MTDILIAFLVSAINEIQPPGKKAFQKIAYFLQESGVPLGLHFGIHLYGPYSPGLAYTLQSMEMEGLINIEYHGMSSLIKPGITLELFYEKETIEELTSQWNDNIQFVLDSLVGKSTSCLELLSTTHFIAKHRFEEEGALDEDEIISDVIKLKRDKFKQSQIMDALSELKQLGYLSLEI